MIVDVGKIPRHLEAERKGRVIVNYVEPKDELAVGLGLEHNLNPYNRIFWRLRAMMMIFWAAIRCGLFAIVRFLLPSWKADGKRCGRVASFLEAWRGFYVRGGEKFPKVSSSFFDVEDPLRLIRLYAASWRALHIIYNYFVQPWASILDDLLSETEKRRGNDGLSEVWIGMKNAQAVRNRGKIFSFLFVRKIMNLALSLKTDAIRVASIAGGTEQWTLHAIAKLKSLGVRVELLTGDIDEMAAVVGKKMAEGLSIADQITWLTGEAGKAKNIWDQIEKNGWLNIHMFLMMGIIDYKSPSWITKMLARAKTSLVPNGIVFTCHIIPNDESRFLRWVISWWMNYRTPKKLAGFFTKEKYDVDVWAEPHRIHCVAVGTPADV